jgi:ABC-type glycerol-3-phosphate transport system substrate-binding protein
MITVAVVSCLAIGSGCKKDQPNNDSPLIFWHAQSDQKAKALRQIINDYNASNPPIKVKEEYVGDYDTIYRKTLTALMAKHPPDLAVAYESMVAQYMKYDALVDLEPYLDTEDQSSREDIFAAFLESNRFPSFGGKLLSMPFTKSILMLYYNRDALEKLGRTGPPATWEEFLDVCRAIKKQNGSSGYAFSRDASTFDGMVYSFGGEVYDPASNRPLFEQAPTVRALELHRELFENGLAREVAYGTYDDRSDFTEERSVFFIRSSTSRPYVAELVKDKFRWDMAVIPHGSDIQTPQTVLFGANICVFKSTPDRQRAAWEFIRYFISKDVTAKWSIETGYLPVRKSALDTPTVKTYLSQHPANSRAIEAIPFARSEPSVQGWQEIRSAIEQAVAQVITKRKSPAEAAQALQEEASRMLQKQ